MRGGTHTLPKIAKISRDSFWAEWPLYVSSNNSATRLARVDLKAVLETARQAASNDTSFIFFRSRVRKVILRGPWIQWVMVAVKIEFWTRGRGGKVSTKKNTMGQAIIFDGSIIIFLRRVIEILIFQVCRDVRVNTRFLWCTKKSAFERDAVSSNGFHQSIALIFLFPTIPRS